MPRIDVEIIKRKIKLIEADLSRLQRYDNLSLSEYLNNEDTQLVVERLLEKITSRIISLNYHILKEEYEVMPQDYYNSFIEIGKNKLISEEMAKEMAGMAGLRNALAHEYDKIDQNLVHESLKLALIQIPNYLKIVLDFLK